MPPLVSDNEVSDDELPTNGTPKHTESNVEADVEAKNQLKDDLISDVANKKGKKAARKEQVRVASPEDDEQDDGEEVYEVEAIREHKWKKNEVLYNVKWKGYPEEDNTWEPEENLASSTEILAQYHHKIGGAPQPPSKTKDLKKKASKKSLRAESGASATEDSPAPPAKRQKRAQVDDSALSDDLDREPVLDNWLPKGSNWESQVKEIQTVERDEQSGDLFIFLEFNNGKKSRVKNGKIRSACPQKLLDFYEAHLNFSVAKNASIAYHTKQGEQEELALSTDSEA